MKERTYIAIDLKSFYASVECVERGLDALDTCLVVADESRTQKTICLAVSPALKVYGTGGRPRLFEVYGKIREANEKRGRNGKNFSAKDLSVHPDWQIDFVIAKPRMALYIEYSSRIYNTYLRFISPDDIHVYSIDEVFIDVTSYLPSSGLSAHDFAEKIIKTVLRETGITATAGIGTNLYLAKIAMDIMAKKMKPDSDGVRIAFLNEKSYRKELWDHLPLTDFWRVGQGIAKKLSQFSIMTMGDIARASLTREHLLYKIFGVNAELLIDHAWGWEPVTIKQIKSYRPSAKSISSGQVLQRPYDAIEAGNVAIEMADAVSYELLEKGVVTDQLVLTIGYDVESISNPEIKAKYKGEIKIDRFGRKVPVEAHGTINLEFPTSSSTILTYKVAELYQRLINKSLLIRRLTLSLNHIIPEKEAERKRKPLKIDLFSDYDELIKQENRKRDYLQKEQRRQKAILNLRKKYGKNVVLKGINYAEGTTQKDRNQQIGGHKA